MAEEKHKLVEKLNDLIALDRDAVGAYEAAIERVEVPFIRERLADFKKDHERHIENLSGVVRAFGAEPRGKPDIKGFILKGFTAVTSMMGTEAALRAMQGNETLTNKTYKEALDVEWPADVRSVIEANYRDEQKHLTFINEELQTRRWEQAPAQV